MRQPTIREFSLFIVSHLNPLRGGGRSTPSSPLPSALLSYHSCFYFQSETDVELGSLLLSECQNVFNQLLLYLSVSKDQVFTGLTILAHNDAAYGGPKEIKTNKEMVRDFS